MQPVKKRQEDVNYSTLANAIRFLSADAVEKAKSGHPGMPLGMADVATVLFQDYLKFSPKHPNWLNRDRFILSAGHGSMLLYSLLYLTGYKDITLDEIKNFRQLDAKTAGHPEHGYAAGIEITTGPLGQGISSAVGFALAERIMNAEFPDLFDHKTYVIASDGDLMEGVTQEAISLAGHWRLKNLVVLYDDNSISIDGDTNLAFTDDTQRRFESCHWEILTIDGHNVEEIQAALARAQQANRPILIRCKTRIAEGAPTKVGTSSSHGSPLGSDEIRGMRENLKWAYEPFEVPTDILEPWRAAGTRGDQIASEWIKRYDSHADSREINRRRSQALPKSVNDAFKSVILGYLDMPVSKATRQLSQDVLERIASLMPELIGGSADLTGSNNTKAKPQRIINRDNFAGNYIHYGVREHGMAAVMNGLSLYGGFRPYGGTFLIFSDYLRPSLRLSALMEQPVIYVLTHDSIGLGEDGPTHQPIEQLASLRAMPNLNVFRPADGIETAECWQIALQSHDRPSIFALTRQNVRQVRLKDTKESLSAKGGYIVWGDSDKRDVTLIATGSEVGLAVDVAELLSTQNIHAVVVSMPCTRLFDEQTEDYRQQTLGTVPRFAIEAASSYSWYKYVGDNGHIFGIDTFGASAPAPQLYDKFGLTVDKISTEILRRVKG
ncbi:MAG: transketolase [Candidatus Paracaedibacteraceae bacterium]|nr:transketolase [Candidatus Paracaedibacteraceae bacterium]